MTHVPAYTTEEETFTGAKGLSLFVRSWRPQGRARGVVAICHGVNSHSAYYRWAAEQFVDTGLAVYALDLHGRGRSGGKRFYVGNVADYLDDLEAVVSLAKSREPGLPVYLLGHSAAGSSRVSTRSSIKPGSPD